MVYSWQMRLVPHMKMVYFKLHFFRKAFVLRCINITFIWNDCGVTSCQSSQPASVSQMHSLYENTEQNNQSWPCYSTTPNILFRSTFFYDKSWPQEVKGNYCFHLGEGLKLIMCQSDSILWVKSAGCFKSENIKNIKKTTQFLCIVIYMKICCHFTPNQDQSRHSRWLLQGKILFHQDDPLLKDIANAFIPTIKEGRNKLKHDFTDLNSFQILLFPWPNILSGNTLDNRSKKLCGWGVSLLAFGPLNSLITKLIWNFIRVLVTKQK